jgi:Tfp pilus assembly protein PilO
MNVPLPLRRDSLLTMTGFTAAAATFIFALYLPGHRDSIKVKAEIKSAEESIREIPVKLAALERLTQEVEHSRSYLTKNRRLIPNEPDVGGVLREVSDLARNAGLQVSRLEPQPPVEYETYVAQPFALKSTGGFRGVMFFLRGLETRTRLYHVEELTMKQENERAGDSVETDMKFLVFSKRADLRDSAENDGRTAAFAADIHPR